MSSHAIDIHAHFFPEPYLKLIELEGAAFGASVDRSNAKGPVLRTAGSGTPPLDATYFDVDARVKAMNRAGVQVHALSLTAPMVYRAGPDLGTRLMGYGRPRDIIEKGLRLSAAERAKILGGNAARLLGLR